VRWRLSKPKIGVSMLSETVRADVREGDIGTQLGEIARANPDVAIASYPFFDPARTQYKSQSQSDAASAAGSVNHCRR